MSNLSTNTTKKVASITMKPTQMKVAEPSVDEALAVAKAEAERQQKYILQLEAEKTAREEQERQRKAKEAAEAQERKQFEAFKSFMAQVGKAESTVTSIEEVKVEKVEPKVEPKVYEASGLFGESTNRLIATMGGTVVVLVVLYLILLGLFGKANDSVALMFDSFPLRMYINVIIVVLAVGVGFLGLRLLFPEQYKYVHSKIESVCSPKQDWVASSPEFRLRFASEQLWRFAFLFVLALMVIFS